MSFTTNVIKREKHIQNLVKKFKVDQQDDPEDFSYELEAETRQIVENLQSSGYKNKSFNFDDSY